jgi:hypothetical protein
VCCIAEPCPVGIVVSRSRTGSCVALDWDATHSRHRCGLIIKPAAVLGLGHGVAARGVARLVSSLATRWIAAGKGCDSDAAVLPGPG